MVTRLLTAPYENITPPRGALLFPTRRQYTAGDLLLSTAAQEIERFHTGNRVLPDGKIKKIKTNQTLSHAHVQIPST